MQVSTTCWLLLASSCCCLDTTVAQRINNYGIYGGEIVNITEVPFMAVFSDKRVGWGCGASIVHEQFLVTAAHCVVFGCKYVTVGTDFIGIEGGGVLCDVEQMFVHPYFNWTTLDYDIGVIKLKNKLTFSDRVKSIKMADPSSPIPSPGDMMSVIGFGQTEHDMSSNNLLKVDIPYVDHESDLCQKRLPLKVTKRMICAGGVRNKNSCHGDSGGPLVYNGKLTGVVSWGSPQCAVRDFPGVFSDVASMRDFIDDIIAKHL